MSGRERATVVAADVIVLGGGLAGLTAAICAREAGHSVTLVEPDPLNGQGSNSRISGGVFHLAWGAMDEPPGQLFDRMVEQTDGEVDRDVARSLARNAGPAISWLSEHGVELGPKGKRPHDRFTCLPWVEAKGDALQPQRGAEIALARLRSCAGQLEVRIVRGWAAGLQRRGVGWEVSCHGSAGISTVAGQEIVVATGGFQANSELMRNYVGAYADQAFLRSTRSSMGTGLRLLLSAGAAMTDPSSPVYGHLVCGTAVSNPMLWPQPTVDAIARRGLLVDRMGRTFDHHAQTGIGLVNAMVASDDPAGCWVVFDGQVHAEASAERDAGGTLTATQTDGHLEGVAQLVERGAQIVEAPTVWQLAQRIGVPVRNLEASANCWQRESSACTSSRLWYALRVLPGVTTTMRGVLVDDTCRVLDGRRSPLTGLRAAGDVVGVHGGPRGGYLGGLAVALITGFVAGTSW